MVDSSCEGCVYEHENKTAYPCYECKYGIFKGRRFSMYEGIEED